MAENVEMIRPINLPEAQQLSENDVFILDSETGGVRKIPKNKVYTPVDDTLSESGEAADAKVTGEKIDELKAETALIQNPVGNKSGELVTFSDGADMPAISVIAHIEPIQNGEGDPSPENVRPISGWESVSVHDIAGKNLFGGRYNVGFAVYIPANTAFTVSSKHVDSDIYQRVYYYGRDASLIEWYGLEKGTERDKKTLTVPQDVCYIAFRNLESSEYQVELGSTATAYEPYQGTTTTVNLGRTVYGGTLDVVSGVLTAYPFYPSYNGETLDGRWICDRAVYAEGTAPPTGSQVALISGTSTTVQLTPTEVKTLLGDNNVWADAGIVDVTYRKDINIVIDELTNAIVSLGSNV